MNTRWPPVDGKPDFAALWRMLGAAQAPEPGMFWCDEHDGWMFGCNHRPGGLGDYERVVDAEVRRMADTMGTPPHLVAGPTSSGRAEPGESTVDTRRWISMMTVAPVYPGLEHRRTRWWRRQLPAPPPWFRRANIGAAIAACTVGLQAPLIAHFTPEALGVYSAIGGGAVLMLGWFARLITNRD